MVRECHSWVDALYFSVVTLSTIGYGDVTPCAEPSGEKLKGWKVLILRYHVDLDNIYVYMIYGYVNICVYLYIIYVNMYIFVIYIYIYVCIMIYCKLLLFSGPFTHLIFLVLNWK